VAGDREPSAPAYPCRPRLDVAGVDLLLDGVVETETYRQRFYDDDRRATLTAAAGLRLLERRPMGPAIAAQPARGRVLWVGCPGERPVARPARRTVG
jgi:hypothetical protein